MFGRSADPTGTSYRYHLTTVDNVRQPTVAGYR